MENCTFDSCGEKAIYLKAYCWKHLSDAEKKEYPNKLINELKNNKVINNANFENIRIIDVKIP